MEFYVLGFAVSLNLDAVGPFKINGVPLRRVNQSYVIATSTKVDISGVNADKFHDKYFAKEKKEKTKKGEGEFFETEKEVCPWINVLIDYRWRLFVCFPAHTPFLLLENAGNQVSPSGEEG